MKNGETRRKRLKRQAFLRLEHSSVGRSHGDHALVRHELLAVGARSASCSTAKSKAERQRRKQERKLARMLQSQADRLEMLSICK